MTRSWTDPRTGKRWRIDVVTRQRERRAPSSVGRGETEQASSLVFEAPEVSYALPTGEAGRLEALEDDRLAELLDAARGEREQHPAPRDAAEEGEDAGSSPPREPDSPSATGRESQPHVDPAERSE